MHSDSIYRIGSTHTTCQDYAAHWDSQDHSIIAVADGCSSSPKSCVGARLLVEAMGSHDQPHDRGKYLIDCFGQDSAPIVRGYALSAFQRRIAGICSAIGIPGSAFDATLLTCVASQDSVLLMPWGDGHVRIEHDDGTSTTLDIDYDDNQNAPYYPSYEIFPYQVGRYTAAFGSPVPTRLWKSERLERPGELGDRYPIIGFPAAGIVSISLFSDGASSFIKGQDEVPVDEITKQCCDFKSTAGELVKRRVWKCQKTWLREDMQHKDDFAQATIWMKEPEQ